MFKKDNLEEMRKKREAWKGGTLKRALERFRVEESPDRFYSPLDIEDHDFLEKVGFPGEYPHTADAYPGTPRPSLKAGGPTIAFDLPTRWGYDSDDPRSKGEVCKEGVAVDTLQDFETLYEAFTGEQDLDAIASEFIIDAPANIIIAMYIALAEKRGIPANRLRGTLRNDILKEYLARGVCIFSPGPSLRMIRDTITYCTEHIPLMNPIGIGGDRMREAGASGAQTVAFTFSHAIAYAGLGFNAGLDADSFIRRFTFTGFGGSMDFFGEIALHRAARRIWAKIVQERFEAKDPESLFLRGAGGAMIGSGDTTRQRPLNNLTRSVLGGIASAISGGSGSSGPCYDEALGSRHSLEGIQLMRDATRIIKEEAKLCDVIDPLAGSYYMESLTDKMEAEILANIEKIDSLGGAVAAIEKGYMPEAIAERASEDRRAGESGERILVGVNRFIGEHELEVITNRLVPDPFDPEKRQRAEERQIAQLKKTRRERKDDAVRASLKKLKEAAGDERENLIPVLVEAVKAYATLGEICNTLKEVFGEQKS